MTRDQAERYLFLLAGQTRRYHFGGDDPIQGFDCSGLAHEWLMGTGIFPHEVLKPSAQQLYQRLLSFGLIATLEPRPPLISAVDPLGALVFFGDTPSTIDHVAICFSRTHMIGMEGGDRSVTTEAAAIVHNAFAKLRPIAYRRGLVGFLRPKYPWD